MGWPVVTAASGGMPVVDVTATTGRGTPVTEATNGFGRAVTKVASGGLAVAFETIGIAPPVTYATLNGANVNVTMSNGNRTATHNAVVTSSGAASTSLKTAGKYYFEAVFTATHGTSDCVGILLSTGTFANLVATGTNCSAAYATGNGVVFSNNGNSGQTLGGNVTAGDVVCVAVNLDARLIWFRRNGNFWYGISVSQDPAAGLGGAIIGAGSFAPAVGFGGATPGNIGDNITLNCGQAAFTQAVPSGFTAGWPP